MRDMKGIGVPIETMVIVSLAVLALAAAAIFFMSASASPRSSLESGYYFTKACQSLRCADYASSTALAQVIGTGNPAFVESCRRAHPETHGDVQACMERCGCSFVPPSVTARNRMDALLSEIMENQG